MFSSLSFFSRIACPDFSDCSLPNCLFSHDVPAAAAENVPVTAPVELGAESEPQSSSERYVANRQKRRRLDDPDAGRGSTSSHSPASDGLEAGASTSTSTAAARQNYEAKDDGEVAAVTTGRRPITPPGPKRRAGQSKDSPAVSGGRLAPPMTRPERNQQKPVKPVVAKAVLNPRILTKSPANYNTRLTALMKLHEQLVRLHNEFSRGPGGKHLFSDNDLILMALDEEEKIGRENPLLYRNIITQRFTTLRKTKATDWAHSLNTQGNESAAASSAAVAKGKEPTAQPDYSELNAKQQLILLKRLKSPLDYLEKYGFIIHPPTQAEIETARKGVESARGWENCDRCSTRFQVFPGRRADGALTSEGSCTYHPGKLVAPPRDRAKATQKQQEKRYNCCSEPVGRTSGCTTAPTHVFRFSEAKRLASIMQFEETPPATGSPAPGLHSAICLDCEMSYTVHGLELVRLTATSWASGDVIIDVLVRPLGEILDLNSRFSGVLPPHLTEAKPHGAALTVSSEQPECPEEGRMDEPALQIVSSPSAARSLLFEHLTADIPLIGHGLENDLNALRIIHPTICDSAVMFPHPRGLPYRQGLKALVSKVLEREIQVSGTAGHDSREDARAAGDLVRWKTFQEWKRLSKQGWRFEGATLLERAVG